MAILGHFGPFGAREFRILSSLGSYIGVMVLKRMLRMPTNQIRHQNCKTEEKIFFKICAHFLGESQVYLSQFWADWGRKITFFKISQKCWGIKGNDWGPKMSPLGPSIRRYVWFWPAARPARDMAHFWSFLAHFRASLAELPPAWPKPKNDHILGYAGSCGSDRVSIPGF